MNFLLSFSDSNLMTEFVRNEDAKMIRYAFDNLPRMLVYNHNDFYFSDSFLKMFKEEKMLLKRLIYESESLAVLQVGKTQTKCPMNLQELFDAYRKREQLSKLMPYLNIELVLQLYNQYKDNMDDV